MISLKKILFILLNAFAFNITVYAIEDIAVMGLIADKAILRVNGAHRIIKHGEVSVDGLRLLEISENRKSITLEVNGEKRIYRLGHGTNTGVATAKLPADSAGMYRTTGKINNISVPFIIDTGATYVSLNKNMAEELGINYINSPKTGKAETANGFVKVYIVELDSVQIGDIILKNVEATIHDGDFPTIALLGMSFLKQVNMKREGNILSLHVK